VDVPERIWIGRGIRGYLTDLLAGLPPERRELCSGAGWLERQAGAAAVRRRETPGPYPLSLLGAQFDVVVERAFVAEAQRL